MRGLDAHLDRKLADYHARQDDDEAWQERVQEEAAYLQNEDPDLDADEAWDMADERLRIQDREAADDEAERQAEKMIGEREAMDDWVAGRMP